ncbi:MAG TPA: stage III sporulation protein AD [Candidatus Caccousia avistercoris]|nr:stage III sporulation protein AD [Candidatus Caccousia avistercoris]
MNVVALAGLAILAAILAVMLRRYHAEYGMILSLAAGAVILLALLSSLSPALEEARSLLQAAALPGESLVILFKALGVCWLAQFAADSCRDAGEGALASKIELAGKTAVLLITLPLFGQVAEVAAQLAGA